MLISQYFERHFWLLQIIITIVVFLLVRLILAYILKRIKYKSQSSNLRKNLYKSLLLPIKILIWIIALSYIFFIISKHFQLEKLFSYIQSIRNILIVSDVTWLILRWKKDFLESKFFKIADKHSIEFCDKIIAIVIVFVSLLIILEILGLDVMPLVAFGGIGAAAIGFAAKDVIANFFGGLMIYITRPFVVGEEIEIISKNIKGTIEHIGWYNTCIREANKVAIYVPNSQFLTVAIRNVARTVKE